MKDHVNDSSLETLSQQFPSARYIDWFVCLWDISPAPFNPPKFESMLSKLSEPWFAWFNIAILLISWPENTHAKIVTRFMKNSSVKLHQITLTALVQLPSFLIVRLVGPFKAKKLSCMDQVVKSGWESEESWLMFYIQVWTRISGQELVWSKIRRHVCSTAPCLERDLVFFDISWLHRIIQLL